MSVKLITYDLKKPGQDYSGVLKYIKNHAWAMLSESSYAIATDASADEIYRVLRPLIDDNDVLLVIGLHGPYQGWASKAVHDWLNKYLVSVPV